MAHNHLHASEHTDGSTDQIQDATAAQKGLATSTQITKLDGIEALADVTDATNVAAAGAVMDSDISAAEGFLRKTGAGAYEAIKSNLAAAVAPTANDDSGAGYAVGSTWIDTTADEAYVCLDASAAAAVWGLTTDAATANPVTAAAVLVDNTLVRGDGGARGVQDSGITIDDSDNVNLNAGNLTNVGELAIKVVSQAAQPTLAADNNMIIWIDTDNSNRVYLIFRRGVGDNVLVELG